MSRYLFKAKTLNEVNSYNWGKEDGEWVVGYYCDKIGLPTISQFEQSRADYREYEIDKRTLCQCTGLKDKNGNLIFENDILLFTHRHKKADVLIKYSYTVKYDLLSGFSGIGTTKNNLMARTFYKCVVIGNKHDKEE